MSCHSRRNVCGVSNDTKTVHIRSCAFCLRYTDIDCHRYRTIADRRIYEHFYACRFLRRPCWSVSESEVSGALFLTQIRVTKAKVVDVVSSYSRSGATGTSAGTASTTAETEEEIKKKGSILYNAVNGLSGMISNLIGE